MADLPLTIACGDYDRTRALQDGRVPVVGCDVTYLALPPEEIMFRAVKYDEFDVAELSLSSYIMEKARGDTDYIALPVPVSRVFRHSSVYIRTDRGITSPKDLKGKIVGIPEYQITAGLWMRGIFQDDHGVKPSDIKWRNGGQEEPGRIERARIHLPDDVELETIPADRTLSDMLATGELDALIGARAPGCFTSGAPNVDRLYPDYRAVEQDYFKRTRLFHIMWVIGIRKELADAHPWLPTNVYRAFVEAKQIAVKQLEAINALCVTLPWAPAELAATRAVMGENFWPYGVDANAKCVETMARYAHEQGLTERQVTVEELFAPQTFETAKV